jgi:hypothetical protein
MADGSAAELGSADYSSAFSRPVADTSGRDAEWWARATFGSAPTVFRWMLLVGWRLVLRLRLGSARSPDHVLGWDAVARDPAAFTMSASSPLIEARNVVLADAETVTWVTTVRYRRPLGRLLWSVSAPIHHRTIPRLLDRAARSDPAATRP